MIYAPAIIFQNVIVCGQAIELGCLSDLSINLTLTDLRLLNNLNVCYSNIFQQSSQTTTVKSSDSPKLKPLKSSTNTDQHQDFSDSGFRSSMCYAEKSKAIDRLPNQKREMPYVWSFVGGHFLIRLYNDRESLAQGIPLVQVKLVQPNMMTIVDAIEQVVHMSMFNLTIRLPDDRNPEEFTDTVFDTHQGGLDDTGIPPAFIELKKTICHAKNETKIKCNIRRSVQIQLTPDHVDKFLSLNALIKGIICTKASAPSIPSNVRPIVRYNNIRELSKLFGVANSIELNVLKISAQFMTSMDRLLNVALFKWNSNITVQKHPEQIAIGMACDSLVINTQNSMLLHPTSFRFDCNLSQEKWSKKLLIATNFTSNGMHFSIDPTDFWTFAKVQLDFWACFNRHFQVTDTENNDDGNILDAAVNSNAENPIAYELPKATGNNSQNNEEYFQDDLR